MENINITRMALILLGSLALASCGGERTSDEAPAPSAKGKCDVLMNYDIAFDRFDETAQQVAHATGCFIHAELGEVGAIKPNPVKGRLTPRQALAAAIRGTPLHITEQNPDSITVK
ncbi:STN domain-containing protein [Salinicola rhizosphaerae]|uniref:Uncharacterized protein n=1 Tax=Salinicola rhizosphaerae TaxID=1443141 RepID=A0ABQ3E9D7_9GAMM|nr:STN domain-containing protein [Salinicola rhizosphaerae]GHB27494.1 hypothetical protein GCM10009038_27690 [Salinicola rhizosphaerae]